MYCTIELNVNFFKTDNRTITFMGGRALDLNQKPQNANVFQSLLQ